MELADAPDAATALRGTAPRRSPTVRVLAAYSSHTDCNVATLAFAASVDMDKLLVGTPFQAQFGQSPFAIARGNQFERSIRRDDYAPALELLRTKMHFDTADARVVNLRRASTPNKQGMALRANHTRALIQQILRRDRHAPNLIDGAVLQAVIGGETAYFEADAIAAQFAGPIHGGEVKSFPVVDGRPEPDKLGAALDQVAIYILLTQQLVAELGGDPEEAVSTTAMLIAPRNVGLTPTLETQNVASRMRRISTLLSRSVPVSELAAGLPDGVFGHIADKATEPGRRLEVLDSVVERIGNKPPQVACRAAVLRASVERAPWRMGAPPSAASRSFGCSPALPRCRGRSSLPPELNQHRMRRRPQGSWHAPAACTDRRRRPPSRWQQASHEPARRGPDGHGLP